MYISYNVAERIKYLARERNISMKKLLDDVGLGVNTMSNMKTSMPKSDNLACIADYLNCSVDYLLGRTDDPTNATLRGFNSLNSEGQSMVMEYIRVLMNDDKYRKVRTAPQQHSLEIAAFGGKGTEGAQPHGAPEITGN